MTPLLPQLRPDLSDDYWRVNQVPALTTEQLGVRVNVDHWLRVQRARASMDAVLPSASHPDPRPPER